MLLLVTIGLVLASLVLLVLGFVQDTLGLIYVAMLCAGVAGLALVIFARLARRRALALAGAHAPSGAARGDDDGGEEVVFPIQDYDDLRVYEILPLLARLDPDELRKVRDREVTGKGRTTVLDRIDGLVGRLAPPASERRRPAGRTGKQPAPGEVAPPSSRRGGGRPATPKTAAENPGPAAEAAPPASTKRGAAAKKGSAKADKAAPSRAAAKQSSTSRAAPAARRAGRASAPPPPSEARAGRGTANRSNPPAEPVAAKKPAARKTVERPE